MNRCSILGEDPHVFTFVLYCSLITVLTLAWNDMRFHKARVMYEICARPFAVYCLVARFVFCLRIDIVVKSVLEGARDAKLKFYDS